MSALKRLKQRRRRLAIVQILVDLGERLDKARVYQHGKGKGSTPRSTIVLTDGERERYLAALQAAVLELAPKAPLRGPMARALLLALALFAVGCDRVPSPVEVVSPVPVYLLQEGDGPLKIGPPAGPELRPCLTVRTVESTPDQVWRAGVSVFCDHETGVVVVHQRDGGNDAEAFYPTGCPIWERCRAEVVAP